MSWGNRENLSWLPERVAEGPQALVLGPTRRKEATGGHFFPFIVKFPSPQPGSGSVMMPHPMIPTIVDRSTGRENHPRGVPAAEQVPSPGFRANPETSFQRPAGRGQGQPTLFACRWLQGFWFDWCSLPAHQLHAAVVWESDGFTRWRCRAVRAGGLNIRYTGVSDANEHLRPTW